MSEPLTNSTGTRPAIPAVANPGASTGFYAHRVLQALAPMTKGRMRLALPNGRIHEFGGTDSTPLPLDIPATATIQIRRPAFFRKCALGGDIGFAESYLDGDWDTPNITAVIAWFLHNVEDAPTLSGSARRQALAWLRRVVELGNRLQFVLRPNSVANARRNISAHYDLSNEFFALFLDRSMMYSAAKWTRPEQSLEQAQGEKNEALCRSLQLTADDHVLEIGTGWGGWALQAAREYGCRVTSLTISEQQYTLARQRIADAGLADRIEVRLQDFRELDQQFDKIVSIEMMEALGHRFLPTFCQTLERVLKPHGLIALQFITCPDHRYDEFRQGVDFIQKHIFPGSLLLSLNRVNQLLNEAGGFMMHAISDLGHDYARTLREWDQAFQRRLTEVRALGFDERFIRKWSYYLNYCEAAFAMRNISVVQTLHTRANNVALRSSGVA